MKVEMFGYEGLTEEEKEDGVSDNGNGKEYATYIRVTHNGMTLLLESDAMEPEDADFSRDLNWIPGIIQKAYNAGLEDGKK